jgi:hypothetical protein
LLPVREVLAEFLRSLDGGCLGETAPHGRGDKDTAISADV